MGLNPSDISIRRARGTDARFFFDLRNDPAATKFSFNSSPVDWDTHKKWFEAKLRDPNDELYVIGVGGKNAGQIRIEVEGSHGEISITLAPQFRGKGIGPVATAQSVKRAFDSNPVLEKILAHIKMDNDASIKNFAKAGFVDEGKVDFKNNRCKRMSIGRGDLQPLKGF